MSETKTIDFTVRDEKTAHLLEAAVHVVNLFDGGFHSPEQTEALKALYQATLEMDEKPES